MKIPLTLQPLLDPSRRDLPSLLQQLRIGQVLPAKVLAQVQPGLVRLQIATTILMARTQVALPNDARLQLEVIKTLPRPELRIIRDPTPREQQAAAVKTAIARQLPPREVRQMTTTLAGHARPGTEADHVRQFLSIQRSSGIALNQLSPAQLRRALQTSGVLHEARLAANLPSDPADTKTRLLQLLALVKAAPRPAGRAVPAADADKEQGAQSKSGGDALLNRLVRLIEGSVSRIQLQQAATLPTEEAPRQAWQIDLPIHLPEESQEAMLRIERDDAGEGEDGSASWSVKLAFDFDTIGKLQCRIGLAADCVSATFWCERDATYRRVEERLPQLQQALEAQGLEVVHIAGVLGDPPEPLIGVPMPDRLLDERA